jgi:DNA (cytosine-5)-methyltransferase 1
MTLTYGSLFSGLGGIDLGLDSAGLQCKWQVEINEYCRRVLVKHWPDVPKWDDVRTFPPETVEWSYSWRGCPIGPFCPEVRRDVTAERYRVDLIAGGDPCQANSIAAGPAPSRAASLGGEFIRVVDVLRPRLVLRENPSHVRRDAPWPWWRFRNELERLGYVVLPFRLRACCVGADHRRDRLFLLGEHADAVRQRVERGDSKAEREVKPEALAASLGPADWQSIRSVPGLRSRAGLPDYVERVKGLGNAVLPAVAELIGRRIIEASEKE